jgi:hypothetical protein
MYMNVWPFRQRNALPILRIRYYRPDPWLPEVGRRCDLCGEWVTTIGDPFGIPSVEAHEACGRATREGLAEARRLVTTVA